MDSERAWICPRCNAKWSGVPYDLATCPHCHGDNLKLVEYEKQRFTDWQGVVSYIEGVMATADSYIKSNMPCFRCDSGGHYMVWPGKRSEKEYTKVIPLLTLPQCPIRFWNNAKNISLPLGELLRSLEVK